MPLAVAVVGRPNVSKSTLFNRLAGKQLAIVHDTPGVTRDRQDALAQLGPLSVRLIDTAGFDIGAPGSLSMRMPDQTLAAIKEAEVCLFVVNARDGITTGDEIIAEALRRSGKPVVLIANKCDVKLDLSEFYALGFGEPIGVSAVHNLGTDEIVDALEPFGTDEDEASPEESEPVEAIDRPLKLAIVGRPNVGKSSLFNRMLGEERSLTGPEAGLTRDSIAATWDVDGRTIQLHDTAGVRKRADKHGAIEYYSSLRSLRAISRCDIVILLVDAMKGPQNADRRLAGIAIEEKKGLIIVGNKYDLVRQLGEFSQNELFEGIHEQLPFTSFAPVTFLSALTKRRLGSLMPVVSQVAENLDRRIPTAKLNAVIQDAVIAHPPPISQDRMLKIFYCAQVSTHPPLFIFSCNEPKLIQPSYKRFIENVIRSNFDFQGVPLTLDFRERPRDETRR